MESCGLGYRAPSPYHSLSSTRFSWGKEANATRSPQLTQPSAAPFCSSHWQQSLAVLALLCFMAASRHPRSCLSASSKPPR